MTESYYQREKVTNSDGTPLYANNRDGRNEKEVQVFIEKAWACSLYHFGPLCPIDYYALRDGRIVGVLELKSRTHEHGRYPTVFLNVRKWLALMMASNGMGCPALFVVRFTDGVRFVNACKVDASKVRMGGTARIVKSHTDIEPVIEVPIDQLKMVKEE